MPPIGRAVERVGDRAAARSGGASGGGSSGGGASGGGARTELVAPEMALAVVAVACFWPVLFGAYIGDDLRLIVQNHSLRADDLLAVLTQPMFGREHGYWRPLTMLVLWLGQHLGPFGVHAIALAIHVVDTLAVRRIALWFVPRTPALWVAVLFAIHPVQAESVGWCAAINDPLWVACALQAMLAAVRWRDADRGGPPLAAMGWTFAALAAKETGVATALLVVAALALVPTRSRRVLSAGAGGRRWGAAIVGLAVSVLAFLVLRAAVQTEPLGTFAPGPGLPTTGAELVRLAQAAVAQCWLLVAPWPQVPVRVLPTWSLPAALALAIAVLAFAALLLRRRRPVAPGLVFAGVLLAAPLLPTLLHGTAIGAYPIADRYLYLAVAGAALAVAHVPLLWRSRWLPWALVAVAAPWTFAACWNWHDLDHFTANALRHAPADPMVLAMAGDLELNRAFDGDAAARWRALALYERAVASVGDVEVAAASQARRSLGSARLGMAWCGLLQFAADRDRGRDRGRVGAVGQGAASPDGGVGAQEAADAAARDAVIARFRAAVEIEPESGPAWVGLGVALGELGRPADAIAAFRHAQQIDQRDVTAARGIAKLEGAVARPGSRRL